MNRKQRRAAGSSAADHGAVSEMFAAAVVLHQQGRLNQAVAAYRRALAVAPSVAALHNNLGLALKGLGRLREAVAAFRQAITCDPALAEAHNGLGNSLADLGQHPAAVAALRQAIALRPDQAPAHNNLAIVLREMGRLDEAEAAGRAALALASDAAEPHNTMGTIRRDQGRPDEAEACYRQAIARDPAHPQAHVNRAAVLRAMGRHTDALAAGEGAVTITPKSAEAWNTLGACRWDLDDIEGAETAWRRAARLAPGLAAAWANLANVRRAREDLEEAEEAARRAVSLDAGSGYAHNVLGMVLRDGGRFDEAERAFCRAVTAAPAAAEAHVNLGMMLLLRGDYTAGWAEYEWRRRAAAGGPMRPFTQPPWGGEPLAGRSLLLHGEQGLGDVLQFARYATVLAERGARVVLEADAALTRLLTGVPGVAAVIAIGAERPACDWHLPLMSAPHALGTTLATIPAAIPYLRAESGDAARWSALLAGRPGPKVGLAWAGNPNLGDCRGGAANRRRSIAPERLAPLLRLRNITFVSLQKGEAAAQIAALPPDLRPVDLMGRVDDFADTAALVAGLDLVIAVDTAVAHLAGALGKPLWLLSRFDGDWRWLRDRDDSPWYPTARIFRQRRADDWDEVVGRVEAALRERFP